MEEWEEDDGQDRDSDEQRVSKKKTIKLAKDLKMKQKIDFF